MVRFQKELTLEEQGVLSVGWEAPAEGRRAWALGANRLCLLLPV